MVGDLATGLVHVGRLDQDTEGLLLLTNDGELAHRLAHPSYGVKQDLPRPGHRLPAARPGQAAARRHRAGGRPGRVDPFRVVDTHAGQSVVEVVLHEGRKHIVRRLLAEVGLPVPADPHRRRPHRAAAACARAPSASSAARSSARSRSSSASDGPRACRAPPRLAGTVARRSRRLDQGSGDPGAADRTRRVHGRPSHPGRDAGRRRRPGAGARGHPRAGQRRAGAQRARARRRHQHPVHRHARPGVGVPGAGRPRARHGRRAADVRHRDRRPARPAAGAAAHGARRDRREPRATSSTSTCAAPSPSAGTSPSERRRFRGQITLDGPSGTGKSSVARDVAAPARRRLPRHRRHVPRGHRRRPRRRREPRRQGRRGPRRRRGRDRGGHQRPARAGQGRRRRRRASASAAPRSPARCRRSPPSPPSGGCWSPSSASWSPRPTPSSSRAATSAPSSCPTRR